MSSSSKGGLTSTSEALLTSVDHNKEPTTTNDKQDSTAGPSGEERPKLNLTTLDKIKRFFFSKEEWQAYLIEKMEEQEKKKGENISLETKSDNTTKRSVVSWLKTVFPSQEDASSFVKTQIDKLQEESAIDMDDRAENQRKTKTDKCTEKCSSSAQRIGSPKET